MYLYSCNTDNSLFIGIMTRQLLRKLLNDGDISERQVTIFYEAARKFFVTATWYGLEHLPLNDPVLCLTKLLQTHWLNSSCELY